MIRLQLKHALVAAMVFTCTQGAQALSISEAFKGVKPGAPACYARRYSENHLARNPRQTVRSIKLKLKLEKFDRHEPAQPSISLQIKRKGETKAWGNSIACMDYEGSVLCAVECDGGSIELKERRENGVLVIKNNNVLLYGGCGEMDENGNEVDSISLESKKGGDDVFALPNVAPENCSDVSDEAH